MSYTTTKTARPPQTSVQLSDLCRVALDRIKQIHGVNKVKAIERGIFIYEKQLLTAAKATK